MREAPKPSLGPEERGREKGLKQEGKYFSKKLS
jgi:hypothetical protein